MPLEKIWIGPGFGESGIFVLGESWYGAYSDELVTDDGWIRAYIEERVPDKTYTRIVNAFQTSRRQFWERVMFTNFVQCVGATSKSRPSSTMFLEAQPRLRRILEAHRPRGVWILGKMQSKYSAPIIQQMGIVAQVTQHPTYASHDTIRSSWSELESKLAA